MACPDISICALASGSFSPRGHAQLPFDEVEPGDRLGHRMLHLQARVHLDEVPGRRRPELPPSTRNSTVPAPS